ncbi:hypothetical protein B0T22DRAFT_516210 [Podospora appendiculata]|uniref:Rhodopsin domain-containing protein n=1 Tax=Podospora appendiculata TaxID=314037 RepID=A0AAE0XDC2_9PEZI|nr:hypothetical protein B0T22DRAFT_516210 [Podospora appendiculata]
MQGLKGYDPDNLQPWTVAVVVSVTVLAAYRPVINVFDASTTPRAQGIGLCWTNILATQAWNFLVVGFIFAMYGCGMGIHADQVPLDNMVMMAKYLVVAEVLYVYNLVWTKISILLMYYRIFRFPYFKKMAYAIGGFIIAWVITITFLFIFICVPVEKLWFPDLPGHCMNQVSTWIANAASTILSDLVILILPIPQVWSLQLRTTEKIAVTLAFCLGFFVVFASAYRFSVLFSYSDSDPSYTLAPTVGWTAIEMSAGIISACLPTLRPVVQWAFRGVGIKDGLFGSRSGASGAFPSNINTNHSAARLARLTDHPDGADLAKVKKGAGTQGGAGAFYRLPDVNSSGQTTEYGVGTDGKLRPEHGHAYAVTSKPGKKQGEGDSLSSSSDEIPLQGIRVQTDFKQFTT